MKLIGAGLPRTGTLTQKMALEQLGLGPCYHWVNVLADLGQVGLWEQALDGDGPWEQLLGGFESTVDWPGGYFYRELTEVYPDAKVLLSVRDPESWERSFRQTIWEMCFGDSLMPHLARARAAVDPGWQGYMAFVDRMFWGPQGTFAAGNAEPSQLIEQMLAHTEAVKAAVPAERLLVWQASDGWGPLCEFLEVEEPAEPLPHENDRESFVERVIGGALDALGRWREGAASA